MGVTFEHDLAENNSAAALDKDLVRVIDHDLGNCVVFKKRLKRSEPEHLVEQRVDQMSVIKPREHYRGSPHVLLGDARYEGAHPFAIADVDLVGVSFHE